MKKSITAIQKDHVEAAAKTLEAYRDFLACSDMVSAQETWQRALEQLAQIADLLGAWTYPVATEPHGVSSEGGRGSQPAPESPSPEYHPTFETFTMLAGRIRHHRRQSDQLPLLIQELTSLLPSRHAKQMQQERE